MSNDEKLMKRALEALKDVVDAEEARSWGVFGVDKQTPLKRARSAIDALRERLAQPEQMTACPHGMPHRWPCEICEPEQEPVAEVKLMMTGGNAGIATVIHEIDNPLRERLRPGQMLYTAPQPQRKPLTKDELRDGARKTDSVGEDLCHWSFERGVRFAEAEHGIKEKPKCCTSTNTQMGS